MIDYPDAFQTKTRKARKEHKCCECYQPIKKGEFYQYSSGIWDGEPSAYKQCLTCYAIFRQVPESEFEEPPVFTGLLEWFINQTGRDYSIEDVVRYYSEAMNFPQSFLINFLGDKDSE